MTNILDRFTPVKTGFSPRTATDLFALRLAQKLHDAPAAAHYATLTEQYSEPRLLNAYRRTLRAAKNVDLARRFQAELPQAGDSGDCYPGNLIAIRVERRTIAAAVFHGHNIEHTQERQLSSVRDKAIASAVGFIQWLLDSLPVESAVLETLPAGEFQRQALTDAIEEVLRDRMLSIWHVPKAQLFEAWAHPALKSRKQLRELVTAVWPVLAGTSGKTLIQVAAALGLYVQTERRFIIS